MREVAINPAYHTRASEQRQRRHSPATPRYLSNMASRGCHAMKISTDVTGHKVSQRRQRQTDRQTGRQMINVVRSDEMKCVTSSTDTAAMQLFKPVSIRRQNNHHITGKVTARAATSALSSAQFHVISWHGWLHGFTGLFTDTSEHIRLLLFSFFSFFPTFLFLVLCSRYSLTYVSFLAHVKIARGIV